MKEWLKDTIQFLNGFRKWSVMMLLVLSGIIFRITGYLTGTEMVDLLRYTAVAFFSANSIEHVTKGVVEWLKKK